MSCDHNLSPVPGCVIHPSGWSSLHDGYVGGTIYVDYASGYIYHCPQKTITAADIICGKLSFEHEAAKVNVKVKAYNSDNNVFNSFKFCNHCNGLGQWQSFSGVGAHQ